MEEEHSKNDKKMTFSALLVGPCAPTIPQERPMCLASVWAHDYG